MATYVMRRRPWYVLAWFAALAVLGWLMPPFALHVYCDTVVKCEKYVATIGGQTVEQERCEPVTKCVERAVPDPYAFLTKLFSSLIFLFTVVAGLYLALKEGVLERLWR